MVFSSVRLVIGSKSDSQVGELDNIGIDHAELTLYLNETQPVLLEMWQEGSQDFYKFEGFSQE